MSRFTLHNEHGDFMSDTTRTLEQAIVKCNNKPYKCKVFETYMDKSPWNGKLVEHAKEVYRNF